MQAGITAGATALGSAAGKHATRTMGWKAPHPLAVGVTTAVFAVVLGYATTKLIEHVVSEEP